VAEVGQGWALEHPWRRGPPPGKWVEVAAHSSFLPTGRVEKLDGDSVLRRGGCSVGRRCPASGWERGGSSGAGVPEEKGGKGVLGAPLTVEGVATAEVTEASTMGRLLTVSSYTDGERMVRGGSWLRSKTRWCGDAGKQRRDGLTGGGAGRAQTAKTTAFRHARSGGAPTVRRRRGLDNGEALSAGTFMARRGRGCVAATWKRCADGWARCGERERLTGGTPR
jgi:hypothetical protein